MRSELLIDDPTASLERYDHADDGPHIDPAREESEAYSVNFVERGSFHLHRGRESWRISRGALFVTRPGLRYRCTHESETPEDVCLSLRLPSDVIEAAAPSAGRGWDEVVPVVPLTNRLAYLHWELVRAVDHGVGSMALSTVVPEVVSALLGPSSSPKLHRAGQLAWYAERVDVARELMERRFAEPLTIEEIAREVGISPFHFCRVFRDLAGLPPHRYLVRVRLSKAAEALRRGESVTGASMGAGFPNLGHFIRLFRRVHGTTPSRFLRAAPE